jgi:putative pyruvate formate lyase activating enzyme
MFDSEFLSRRAALARQMYQRCELCEHRCRVDRLAGQRGVCGADTVARVWRYWIDHAEELPLVPSLLIYLSGCDLRCDFCISEANAFDPRRGVPLTAAWLDAAIEWGLRQGARTLQWIGGEPTIHAPAILDAMARCGRRLPVVWKSDFYGTAKTWELLDSVVDVYVADFKFGNNACARRIAGVERYVEVVTRNLTDVAQRAPLYVRHLLLPGHRECCLRPILAWLQQRLPHIPLSIRDGYLPRWRAKRHAELSQPLARGEGQRALELAADYGLTILD